MQVHKHIIAAVVGGVAPDVMLLFFGWRKVWLPESHPLVKLHRLLHSPRGLVLAWLIGWTTHVVADWLSPHRENPND